MNFRAATRIIPIGFALLFVRAVLAATPCEDVVCVDVEKRSDAVTFYAISRADGVSISFSVSAVNMEPSSPQTFARALRIGRTELATLKVIPGKKPLFEHAYFWEWGVVGAKHDDRVSYRLPFEAGRRFRLYQGPNGTLSHKGEAAFDFPMPLGTPVCAARAGMVIEVVDGFDEGGDDPKFMEMANKVLIVHEDGTIGAYLHLLRGGMRVKTGDRVEAGTVIGQSGNSGKTTGPHLHFEVYRRLETFRRETIAVKFSTAEGNGVVLEEGKSYLAE